MEKSFDQRNLKISAQAPFEHGHRQLAIKFSDVAFSMEPMGLHGVEPGALSGQQDGQQANITGLLGVLIMGSNPTVELFAFVPTGSVPEDEQDPFALYTPNMKYYMERSAFLP